MAAAGGSGPLGMPWSGRLTPRSPSADVSPTRVLPLESPGRLGIGIWAELLDLRGFWLLLTRCVSISVPVQYQNL